MTEAKGLAVITPQSQVLEHWAKAVQAIFEPLVDATALIFFEMEHERATDPEQTLLELINSGFTQDFQFGSLDDSNFLAHEFLDGGNDYGMPVVLEWIADNTGGPLAQRIEEFMAQDPGSTLAAHRELYELSDELELWDLVSDLFSSVLNAASNRKVVVLSALRAAKTP